MYKQFYLMEKEPFDIHPSPELFYKSNAHQNGWGYLYQGIKSNEPILLVTGEYGTGKTLLCLRLIKLLTALKKKKDLPFVYLSTPTYDFTRVLEKIVVELNIPMDGVNTSKESKLQQLIYDYFEAAADRGKENCIYLVIDDAQDFSYSFINKLRLLCSYNVSGLFPIRLILFAHQDFFGMLSDKKNAAMAQRIRRVYRLNPFGFEDTREYIYFRLMYSGASGAPVFDDDAIKLIQNLSRGIPRLINNICDNCLLIASNERLNDISETMVREAMEMGNMVGVEGVKGNDESISMDDAVAHDLSQQDSEYANPLPHLSEDRKETTDNGIHLAHSMNESGQNWENREYKNEQSGRPDQYDDAHTGTNEDKVSVQEDKNKNSVRAKNIGEYAKKGIIIILVMIILYLLYYIFSQNNSMANKDLQSANDQMNSVVSNQQCDVGYLNLQMKNHIVIPVAPDMRACSGETGVGVLGGGHYDWHLKWSEMNGGRGSRVAWQGESQCEIG